MQKIPRRGFLGAPALAAGAAASIGSADPQAPTVPVAVPAKDVTRKLAAWVVSSRREDVPAAVRHEATRTVLNWVGCAVGGSRHETVDIAIRALSPFCGPAQATVLGRKERFDVLYTSFLNGVSSHIFDF